MFFVDGKQEIMPFCFWKEAEQKGRQVLAECFIRI